jgi:hypothetical protein
VTGEMSEVQELRTEKQFKGGNTYFGSVAEAWPMVG